MSLSKLGAPISSRLTGQQAPGDRPGFTSLACWSPYPASDLSSGLWTQVLVLHSEPFNRWTFSPPTNFSAFESGIFHFCPISDIQRYFKQCTEWINGTNTKWLFSRLRQFLWKMNVVCIWGGEALFFVKFSDSCLWLCANRLNVDMQTIWRQLVLSLTTMCTWVMTHSQTYLLSFDIIKLHTVMKHCDASPYANMHSI